MELKQNSTASVQLSETESTESGELDSVLLQDQDAQIQSENVIRELDSADNAYSKGDTRKVYLAIYIPMLIVCSFIRNGKIPIKLIRKL